MTPVDRRSTAFLHAAVGLLLSATSVGQVAAQAPRTLPSEATVAARLDEYMSALDSLGYAGGLLVVRDGKALIQKSYGFADRDAGIRADSSTVYNLGSITKQFTAAAILRLEEMGKLRTTDSIARFFANVPADKRGITLHHLLTHSSGLESDFSPTDYEPTTRDEYVRRALASHLRTPPGQTYFYANAGYSLLAAIVEVVTAKSYEDALAELILRPAGMLETGYKAPHWAEARIAHGYQNGQDWGTIASRIAPADAPYWALRGNGGLHTTLGDMFRWDVAQGNRSVLADSSRKKYTTGYVNEGPGGESQYAYGWAIMRTRRGTRLVTHNGGNRVYVAELLRFVDEGVTIFLTSTVSELTASPVVTTLERITFGEPYELPPRRVAIAGSTLSAVAGTYRVPDGSRLTIRVAGEKLFADADGQQAYSLLTVGDTTVAPRVAELNRKAATIVEALVRGDVGPLRRALDDAPDSAELTREEGGLMADRRNRFGTYRSFAVMGTVQAPGGPFQTTVRLDFERGAVTNIYLWDPGDRIIDVGARPYQPTELIAVGEREFRSFNARSGTSVHLRFEPGVRAAAVLADTKSGPARLVRE